MGTKAAARKQAVDAPRTNLFLLDPNQLILIGVDTEDDEQHPLWDKRAFEPVDAAMVANILAMGVIKPILARSVDGEIQVVDGRRRVLHARAALAKQVADGIPEQELLRVPVRMLRGEDAHLAAVSRTANSFFREESILEKAWHAQRLLGMGRSEADVALTYGVDELTVKAWLSLLDSDQSIRKAILEGKLAASAAYRLARLPRADQRKALTDLLSSGHVSIREARRVTAKQRGRGDTVGAPRRTLRAIREVIRETGDERDNDEYLQGVAAALDLVLGTDTDKLDGRLKWWTDQAAQRLKRRTERHSKRIKGSDSNEANAS